MHQVENLNPSISPLISKVSSPNRFKLLIFTKMGNSSLKKSLRSRLGVQG